MDKLINTFDPKKFIQRWEEIKEEIKEEKSTKEITRSNE